MLLTLTDNASQLLPPLSSSACMFLFDIHDLPPELIPHFLSHLQRPVHLAQACLVSRSFYAEAVPILYERLAIYAWHRDGKNKALQLMRTLAANANLARHVLRLEIRDFPKAVSRERSTEITGECVRALENCINLASCTWTRDGSLKDATMEALTRCPHLNTLEINGHHNWNYDPDVLLRFRHLQKLSIIMPSSEVVNILPTCIRQNVSTLKALTIVCKFTNHVSDNWLKDVSGSLSSVNQLHLAGCPKVTHEGVLDVLSQNTDGLSVLALEGVSPRFDMMEFGMSTKRQSFFSHLASISLTLPSVKLTEHWLKALIMALSDSPLTHFHLYSSGGTIAVIPAEFELGWIETFMTQHGSRLKRFAMLRTPLRHHSLRIVAQMGLVLQQLFVSMWTTDLPLLGPAVALSKTIRAVHVTYAYNALTGPSRGVEDGSDDGSDEGDEETRSSGPPLPTMTEIHSVVSQFGSQVVQFGLQTRVWQIKRVTEEDQERSEPTVGRVASRVELAPYENVEIPDVFLVVRT